MSRLFYGSIDVTKIDKSKIESVDKNGNAFKNGAKYLPITIWVNDEPDNYGNKLSVQQGQSLEERNAKAAKIYLGNLKENEPKGQQSEPTASQPVNDTLPF